MRFFFGWDFKNIISKNTFSPAIPPSHESSDGLRISASIEDRSLGSFGCKPRAVSKFRWSQCASWNILETSVGMGAKRPWKKKTTNPWVVSTQAISWTNMRPRVKLDYIYPSFGGNIKHGVKPPSDFAKWKALKKNLEMLGDLEMRNHGNLFANQKSAETTCLNCMQVEWYMYNIFKDSLI